MAQRLKTVPKVIASASKTPHPITQREHPVPMTYGVLPVEGYIRQRELLQVIPISASTLWRRIKLQTFPAPIKLSDRITCWQVEAVRSWLDQSSAK